MEDVAELVIEHHHVVVAEEPRVVARCSRDVRDDRRDPAEPMAVRVLVGQPDRPRHRVTELARPRVEIEVEPAESVGARPVADLVEGHVWIPGHRLVEADIVQAEDVAGQIEEPVDRGHQRQIGGDLVRVDPVLLGPDPLVVVGDVPWREVGLARIALEVTAHRRVFLLRQRLERREDRVVEGRHALRGRRHLRFDPEVRPGWIAQELRLAAAQGQRLLEDRPEFAPTTRLAIFVARIWRKSRPGLFP